MPRRERSFAQEIEDRMAAGGVADEGAARAAVADDLATGRLRYRCLFEKGSPGTIKRLEFGIAIYPEFVPVRISAARARYLWQQIRAGKIDGEPVKYSPDNETITAGWLRIIDITVWDRSETTAASIANSVTPAQGGPPARGAATKPAPLPQSHGVPASPKHHPGDTNKDRGELLYQAAKPHAGSLSWTTDLAFAAAESKFPGNPLLLETGSRTRRRAWEYAKQKLLQEA
jgi:hypothetical protein